MHVEFIVNHEESHGGEEHHESSSDTHGDLEGSLGNWGAILLGVGTEVGSSSTPVVRINCSPVSFTWASAFILDVAG